MVRDRPRRKSEPRGEWRPFLHGALLFYASDEDAIKAKRFGIDAWNTIHPRQEHALFRVPAVTMDQVYPAEDKRG
jgi:hypothetical protein